jgi:phosphodiester glycosidase
MLEPSNSSLGIRSVEWLRDHGAAGLVTKVESIYYSLTAPAKGGPALHALPHVGVASAGTAPVAAPIVDRPPRVAPLTSPALPGEGVWHTTQVGESATNPPLLVSTFRSDPTEYPRLVAGVAWINTSNTVVTLYAGRLEPSVEMPSRGPLEVPVRYRPRLLATFNSGFKLADSGGGWALYGHAYAPMADGRATFVRYTDGRYDVIDWQGGPQVPSNVVFARQNLPLIVNGGRPNPNLNDGPEWGATLGNAILVWRSAIGVDRHGNLIYVAAPDQTVRSLADILIHAGAVRAMELDINSYWTSFITYAGANALDPSNLLSGMERPSSRYLTPDDRDFFAVYSR